MRDDATPFSGFDHFEPECLAGLTCHIEMEVTGGRTPREVSAVVAEALRSLADRIESGSIDTGHHPISTSLGTTAGEVYLDYFGEG